MDVLVHYHGAWGAGDLLCSDPMILGIKERDGAGTRIWFRGNAGNVAFNPLVSGPAPAELRPDVTVDVKLFTHMPVEDYARLEAMPSLIDHMCTYAGVRPSDRRPRLHLRRHDFDILEHLELGRRPRIAICADHLDPLRHWPVDCWQQVADILEGQGASVVGLGVKDHLGTGLDLVGRLSLRQTAAVLTKCDLFLGNNSGLFHYAQAAGLPCVVLFSLASPERFFHPGARVYPVQAEGLPCLHCMTRCFTAMQKTGCIAAPRGRCMFDIPLERVLEKTADALDVLQSADTMVTACDGSLSRP
jgi:ADP-heptose:LPS heptosyltransferase